MSIDAAFESARAAAHNAPRRRFAQGTGIGGQIGQGNLDASKADGLCGGVSLAYLGLYKSGQSLFSVDAASPKASWQYINRAQDEVVHSTMEQCNFEMAGGGMGLTVKARSIVFNAPVSTGMSTWIASKPGLYLVGMPVHYCAVIHDSKKLSFFDPNCGEVFFPPSNTQDLETFMQHYLNQPDVSSLYQLTAGNKVYLTWYQ
ncbi:MAG: hypothetical protein EKK47_19915 [Burkholderiales bacterium]|nr:MAG: hypothetical protein EKK47_19915 [Burkholderiales bacterium]